MRLAFKYRLYPTKAQIAFLEGQLREACELYNDALSERRDAWKTCRKSVSFYDQDAQLKPIREEGLIGIVNFSCARDVLRRVDLAFKAFFAKRKLGQRAGFPRYRSVQRYDSVTFPMYGNGFSLLDNRKLRVQGAGHIKVKLHRPLEGAIKTGTIKREAGRWFVIFVVEVDAVLLPCADATVGVDMGLDRFATMSDGTEIANPRYYRKAQKELRRAERKVTRRRKGSHRRRKAVQELQRLHVHVRNQRRDFQHKESRKLVNANQMIVVEDLKVNGLASRFLAKSIKDAAWAMFIDMLSYKAENAGRRLVKVDPRGTSQLCICGSPVPKTLADRWHHCSSCGLSAPRDAVSAQLILSKAWTVPSQVKVEVVNSSLLREAVA